MLSGSIPPESRLASRRFGPRRSLGLSLEGSGVELGFRIKPGLSPVSDKPIGNFGSAFRFGQRHLQDESSAAALLGSDLNRASEGFDIAPDHVHSDATP